MSFELKSVFDPEFKSYGKVAENYSVKPLIDKLNEISPKPETGAIYVPSDAELEKLPIYKELQDRCYGGMPIQIGYCNGGNTMLNCLEYHRDSEINIAADDAILLLARMDDIEETLLDTAKVKAFLVPAGTAVEVYATTLHYAPCEAKKGNGFRVAIVLPRGTNTDKPAFEPKCHEDTLLTACNKWLLAHPDSSEAKSGAVVGLTGKNIDIAPYIK
jgi:hypothetical protein